MTDQSETTHLTVWPAAWMERVWADLRSPGALTGMGQYEEQRKRADTALTAPPRPTRSSNSVDDSQDTPTTTVEGTEPWRSAAQTLLDETGSTIVKWRPNLTGTSYTHKLEIEVPRPKTAKSFAVFAHEIGHQRLHQSNGKYPRWREEVEAWEFALSQFPRFGLKGARKIRPWVRRSVHYAFHKATRRGVDYETIRKAYPQWDWA